MWLENRMISNYISILDNLGFKSPDRVEYSFTNLNRLPFYAA